MVTPRMDGTREEAMLWRIGALREALLEIVAMDSDHASLWARNALDVDAGNAEFTLEKRQGPPLPAAPQRES